MTEYPAAVKAQARYLSTNGANSSVITLTDNTTQIEVASSSGGGCVIRWVPATETAAVSPFASVTTANFDHYVSATPRKFVVPRETVGTSSIVGANVQNGLYRRVAIMSSGPISSVILSEY